MSYIARLLPQRLSIWVLGKSLGAMMDVMPWIRVCMTGIGAVVIGALLAVIALMGLLATLYMVLTNDLLLSPSVSLLIVTTLCAGVSVGAFAYMRVYVLQVPATNLSRIRKIITNTLEGDHSDLFHTSKDIVRNFADGFMRK